MNFHRACEYIKSYFPDLEIDGFGRLISFRYYNNPNLSRFAIVEKIYSDHIKAICLLRHSESPEDAQRSFYFSRFLGAEVGLPDGTIIGCREYYERFINTHHPGRRLNSEISHNLGKPQIYFTGFAADEKKELDDIASQKGFWVTSGMTQNMAYLVCGKKAGRSKIEKARKMDTIIMNREGFLRLIDSGEITAI
ncbi:BRCT domain-containing protein [Neisseria dentiae]|uniref:BRCT domain-containing protein n=1 Tax=Neisseria dentiae TaxID=194197 RepID=UPI00359FC4E2